MNKRSKLQRSKSQPDSTRAVIQCDSSQSRPCLTITNLPRTLVSCIFKYLDQHSWVRFSKSCVEINKTARLRSSSLIELHISRQGGKYDAGALLAKTWPTRIVASHVPKSRLLTEVLHPLSTMMLHSDLTLDMAPDLTPDQPATKTRALPEISLNQERYDTDINMYTIYPAGIPVTEQITRLSLVLGAFNQSLPTRLRHLECEWSSDYRMIAYESVVPTLAPLKALEFLKFPHKIRDVDFVQILKDHPMLKLLKIGCIVQSEAHEGTEPSAGTTATGVTMSSSPSSSPSPLSSSSKNNQEKNKRQVWSDSIETLSCDEISGARYLVREFRCCLPSLRNLQVATAMPSRRLYHEAEDGKDMVDRALRKDDFVDSSTSTWPGLEQLSQRHYDWLRGRGSCVFQAPRLHSLSLENQWGFRMGDFTHLTSLVVLQIRATMLNPDELDKLSAFPRLRRLALVACSLPATAVMPRLLNLLELSMDTIDTPTRITNKGPSLASIVKSCPNLLALTHIAHKDPSPGSLLPLLGLRRLQQFRTPHVYLDDDVISEIFGCLVSRLRKDEHLQSPIVPLDDDAVYRDSERVFTLSSPQFDVHTFIDYPLAGWSPRWLGWQNGGRGMNFGNLQYIWKDTIEIHDAFARESSDSSDDDDEKKHFGVLQNKRNKTEGMMKRQHDDDRESDSKVKLQHDDDDICSTLAESIGAASKDNSISFDYAIIVSFKVLSGKFVPFRIGNNINGWDEKFGRIHYDLPNQAMGLIHRQYMHSNHRPYQSLPYRISHELHSMFSVPVTDPRWVVQGPGSDIADISFSPLSWLRYRSDDGPLPVSCGPSTIPCGLIQLHSYYPSHRSMDYTYWTHGIDDCESRLLRLAYLILHLVAQANRISDTTLSSQLGASEGPASVPRVCAPMFIIHGSSSPDLQDIFQLITRSVTGTELTFGLETLRYIGAPIWMHNPSPHHVFAILNDTIACNGKYQKAVPISGILDRPVVVIADHPITSVMQLLDPTGTGDGDGGGGGGRVRRGRDIRETARKRPTYFIEWPKQWTAKVMSSFRLLQAIVACLSWHISTQDPPSTQDPASVCHAPLAHQPSSFPSTLSSSSSSASCSLSSSPTQIPPRVAESSKTCPVSLRSPIDLEDALDRSASIVYATISKYLNTDVARVCSSYLIDYRRICRPDNPIPDS